MKPNVADNTGRPAQIPPASPITPSNAVEDSQCTADNVPAAAASSYMSSVPLDFQADFIRRIVHDVEENLKEVLRCRFGDMIIQSAQQFLSLQVCAILTDSSLSPVSNYFVPWYPGSNRAAETGAARQSVLGGGGSTTAQRSQTSAQPLLAQRIYNIVITESMRRCIKF